MWILGGRKMLEILQYIFSSFWIFIGSLMMVAIIGSFLVGIIGAIRGCDVKISVFGNVQEESKEDD
jgi:uncharacterized membrane protein